MKTVVMIGAGPACLTAAYRLLSDSREWRVVILEAGEQVGGLSRTVMHNGCRLDIGGHRFFSKSDEINDIWRRLMPVQGAPSMDDATLSRPFAGEAGGPDPERTDRVMLRRRRLSRIYYLRRFFDYPVSPKLSTIMNMGIWRTLLAAGSYCKSAICKRKEKSLEDFYINRFGKALYSMFFEDYTEKLWGIHPSAISPEWGAQRVKGLSLWKAVVSMLLPRSRQRETSLIEEFSYPKYGPGQLWEIMADEVRSRGAEVRLGCEVTGVAAVQGRVVSVTYRTADGSTHEIACDALFSSMPVKDLVAAFGDAPADIVRLAASLPYRDFQTVGLLVNRLAVGNSTHWPTLNDIIPDTWIYVQEREVRLGRLQIFNNWSPYMIDDPSRHVWIGLEYFSAEGDDLWRMSDADFVAFAAAELRKIGLLSADEPILDSVRIRERKAYPAYFGSYARFGEVRTWLDSFSNLYCIGRNGQHRYNNMDHSMLCGLEAARSLLTGSDKSAVWRVNTEREYHESA